MHFDAPTPVLRMFDEAKARQFYVDFLEFEVYFEHRFEQDAPLYMGLSRGDCRLHLSEHHGDASPGASVRIRCSDVRAYQRALLAKKYKYYRPGLLDTDWGTTEMTVEDGFGNKLIFFQERTD
jgi:uncharacterized glyoxalase superfamily protein PhnB